jgi:HK97 family phage major capsid protein
MPNADAQVRDRLKKVREDLRAARDQRVQLNKEVESAKQAFAGTEPGAGQKITEMPEFQNAEKAVKDRGECDDQIADLRLAEQSILQMLGDNDSPDVTGGSRGEEKQITGWDGHRLVAAGTAYAQAKEQGLFSSTGRFGTIQLGQIATREQAVRFLSELPGAPAGPVTSSAASGLIQPDRRGLIAPLLRPLRLLDLIPTGTTDTNSVEYVQVTAIPNTVAPVAEGTVKPEVGITLADATAPVRTLAGWIKVNRQALDDAAGLATIINTLLPHDVRRKIEAQILNGDGTGQNLLGILQQTGLGAPAFVTGDNVADAILRAMTVVILSEGEPNFAALNPLSWQDLLLMRENADRSGQYLYGGPGGMAAATVWGLTVVPTTAIAQAAPLVGDSSGATLLVREGVSVKTSDSDQDDFVRNRVTVLAEARVAFPVWRPSHFAIADTTA